MHPFGSCERHSRLTEEMYIPLVHVNVILDIYLSIYLSRSLADRWGTTVDFTTSFLHSSWFSALCNTSSASRHTEEMYIPLVHVNVILNLQKRCTSLWFMWTSFWTYRRDAPPFGSCERHSRLTEKMYIPLVHVNVILDIQKRCTSLWFMWTSFWTYRRDAHPFGSCERHSELT